MTDVCTQKFNEWIRDRSLPESTVSIFERVRDIPYAIIPKLFSLEKGPIGMLQSNKGFCLPKSYLLGQMYGRLGISTQYFVCSFRWSQMDLDYPVAIKKISAEIPETYHMACKISIEGEWFLVDATWDSGLKGAGFPLNTEWDGRSDTTLAVKPIENFSFETAPEAHKFFKTKTGEYSITQKAGLIKFSLGLGKWLEEIRTG